MHTMTAMTVFIWETFGNFILFKGKILKFKHKNMELQLAVKLWRFGNFSKMRRESGKVFQNGKTLYLLGELTDMDNLSSESSAPDKKGNRDH